jgi:polyadenylate-binding protein
MHVVLCGPKETHVSSSGGSNIFLICLALRKRGNGNIFIKNLDKAIDSKALYDTFSAFGNILSCKVATDENGSRGYGFVHYDSDEAAEKAIKSVNGMLLNDKKVFVGLHIPRRERESKAEEFKKHFTNIFVKNLPESVDQEQFEKMFGEFGPVTSAALTTDEDGKSKGFGFVNYENHESASKAVETMNEKEIDGKNIYVGRAQKKSEREEELRRKFEALRLERMNKYQGVNLYVKNLDENVEDEQLRQEFAPFGTISSARIMRDEKGASRGFGFVCFSAPEEANKAVAELNGKLFGTKPLYVALAQRRDARRAMLENQFTSRQRGMGIPMYPGMPMYGQPMPGQMGAPMPQAFYPGYRPGAQVPQQMPYMPQFQQPSRGPPRGGQQNPPMRGQRPQQNNGGFPQQGVPRAQQAVPQQARPFPQQQQQPNALAPNVLAKLDRNQQRQMIGERLFPLVAGHPLVAGKHQGMEGKITGMLLDMEVSELLHLLESPEALNSKLEEAVSVLEQFMQSSQ